MSAQQGNERAIQYLSQGLPILSSPQSSRQATRNARSFAKQRDVDNDDVAVVDGVDFEMLNLFQSLKSGIKRIHRKISKEFINTDDALNDIDNFLVDKNLSNCITELCSAGNALKSLEDKAYFLITKDKQRKNCLPKLFTMKRNQILLNDSSEDLSESEFDDELYKLGYDIRNLDMRLKSLNQEILNLRQ